MPDIIDRPEAVVRSYGGLVDSYALWLSSEDYAAKTRRGYTDAVWTFAAYQHDASPDRLDPEQVTSEDVQRYKLWLAERYQPASRRSYFVRLRQFFVWLEREGEIDANPTAGLSPPKLPRTRVQTPSAESIARLARGLEGKGFADRRDRAIVLLLYDAGPRRAELAGLRMADLDLRAGTARVTRKGGDEDYLSYGRTTAAAIDRYLRVRARHPHADLAWLWLGGKGRFTADGIYQMVVRRARDAGMTLSPHKLRHAFVQALLDSGVSLLDAEQLGGWTSDKMLRTTYARDGARRRAHEAHARHSPVERLRER